MTLRCDRCHRDYDVRSTGTSALVYVEDRRCNHLRTKCPHCGTVEVVFLGPHRLEGVVRSGGIKVEVYAEAHAELRIRAETAWAAAEGVAPGAPREGRHQPRGAGQHEGGEQHDGGTTVEEHLLTPRHEELLQTFGQTLRDIPDELLWAAMNGDHGPDHPEHWTD